jgi:hypothetical protein
MSHGTGRAMSRSDCKPLADAYDFAFLRKSILIPAGVENASLRTDGPFAYRDLDECLALIEDYVEVITRFGVIGYMGGTCENCLSKNRRANHPSRPRAELLAADGRGLDARLREIDEFVQKRLQDIRGLLFADVPRAKSELSKHCTAITLTPEGSTFRITGDWNLLGGRSDGAGGLDRTTRAYHFGLSLAA